MSNANSTLLVVDDLEMNRNFLAKQLRSEGFVVYCAKDGASALALIESNPEIDLVLLDIIMPGMDGFDVLTCIRKRFSSTDLIVVMVTARTESEDIVKALQTGADDYLLRPIDLPVALARIKNQLARRQTEIALRESEARYVLAARAANEGLWDWDLRTGRVYFSERWATMLGYEPGEIVPEIDTWFSKVHPDDLDRLKQAIDAHLSGETENFSCDYRMLKRDGSWRWLLSRGQAVPDRENNLCRILGWQTDTALRVEHDSLTALPNRGLFLARVSWAAARQSRTNSQEFALFYLGIDRFKLINETLGHEGGDAILRQVVDRLCLLIRPQDTLARMGGDEFAILFEELNGVGTATQVADRIKSALNDPFIANNEELRITLSIGIVIGDHLENGEALLDRAHAAMELAKKLGKDTYAFYQEGMNAVQKHTLKMENNLRKALENHELFLVYQPQIDTATSLVLGVEALLRWRCPHQGLVPPNLFIPIAEETGLIDPIGAWVLQEACRQNKAWQAAGLRPIRVAVNVSSRQFRNRERLFQTVEQALHYSGLAPKWLELEITESLLMANIEQTQAQLAQFHSQGIHVSLDDFGTGYSSLSYLKKFPIDTLKIDQSFVRDINTDPDDAAICSTIISMAHSLRMKVIAEGVETYEQFAFLKDLNCDLMQGYLFSKPSTAEEIQELLFKQRAHDHHAVDRMNHRS